MTEVTSVASKDMGFDRKRQQEYQVTPFRVREGVTHVIGNVARANAMFRLFRASCSDFMVEADFFRQEGLLRNDLLSGNTFGVQLWYKKKLGTEMVGFTYARPAPEIAVTTFERERDDFLAKGGTEEEFAAMQEHTAAVMWTVVHPNHRQRGGFSSMIRKFDEEILSSGKFDYMVCQVRHANGLADATARRYDGKIEYREEVPDSPYGPQTYFRIKLR